MLVNEVMLMEQKRQNSIAITFDTFLNDNLCKKSKKCIANFSTPSLRYEP